MGFDGISQPGRGTNQARRGSRGGTPHISPQTSYRLDNRNYTGGGKESDEKEVTLCRRKTTTKRSQRREHCQLHPWVHLRDTFRLAYFESAPVRLVMRDGPGLVTTRSCRARVMAN